MEDNWITKQVTKYIVINEKLSCEAFGCLYKGFYKDDETKLIAVKIVKIATFQVFGENPKLLELFKQEIAILQKINHPNIIRMIDIIRTNNYVYIILEYCADGNLKKYMAKKKENRLSEVEAILFINHIVEGFKILYQNKIIHRNIKPDNILLHEGIAKITDFSIACVIDSDMNAPTQLTKMGTPLYMAPQILQGKPFSSKSDIWSLGVTLYEILYGRVPWEGKDFESFFENVQKQPISFPNKPVRSNGVKELITKMLQIEESDRISWQEVFECQILKKQEQINQPDFINIFQEKDELGKSILINKCYLDQYLVARYLIQDHIVVLEKQKEVALKSFGEVRSKSINYEQDVNSEILLRNQQIETKRKAAMLKYYNYFLFERNVSFFFNFVAQKIIQLQQKQSMLPNESYYGLLFFIAKNQLIHLERVNEQFTKKVHEKFNQETWDSFLLSEEFKKLKSLIQKDLKYSLDFFQQISKAFNKTVDIDLLKRQISKNKKNFILEIENFNNNSFKIDQGFYQLYHEIIGDNINELINIKNQEIDFNLLILYLSICLKPYEEFKEITFDFDIFYEQIEQQKLNDIYERLLQKGVQLQILI